MEKSAPLVLRILALLVLGALSLALYGAPVGALAAAAAEQGGGFLDAFAGEETMGLVFFTLKQAALSLALSVAIGVPFAFLFDRFHHRWLQTACLALATLPSLFVAGAVLILRADSEDRYSFGSVVLGHVLLNAPWIAFQVGQALREVPRSRVEAARTLGASAGRAFRDVKLPHARHALENAAAQVFAWCVMSFGLVLLVGGGPPVQTLETEIYAAVRMGDFDLTRALGFAAWQLMLTLIPVVFLLRRRDARWLAALPAGRSRAGIAFAALLFAPYAVFFGRALGGLPAETWTTAFADRDLLAAFEVSVALALGTGGLTVALALLWGKLGHGSRTARVLGFLPAGISPLVLSLGFFLAYSKWIDPFEGSLPAMIAIQATLLLPMGYRMLLPLMEQGRPPEYAVARTLGAGPIRAWRDTVLPHYRAYLGAVFGLAFALSLGELASVSFFSSENLMPVSVYLSRLWSQYRFDETTLALLALFTLGVLVIRFSLGQQRKIAWKN